VSVFVLLVRGELRLCLCHGPFFPSRFLSGFFFFDCPRPIFFPYFNLLESPQATPIVFSLSLLLRNFLVLLTLVLDSFENIFCFIQPAKFIGPDKRIVQLSSAHVAAIVVLYFVFRISHLESTLFSLLFFFLSVMSFSFSGTMVLWFFGLVALFTGWGHVVRSPPATLVFSSFQ